MAKEQSSHQPGFSEALIVAATVLSVLSFLIIGMGWVMHVGIVAAMVGLLIYETLRGVACHVVQAAVVAALNASVDALYLFFFIALLVSALLLSIALPSSIDDAVQVVDADWFFISQYFIAQQLKVSTLGHLPYACCCYLSMLLALAFPRWSK